jgi:hypothetical protein
MFLMVKFIHEYWCTFSTSHHVDADPYPTSYFDPVTNFTPFGNSDFFISVHLFTAVHTIAVNFIVRTWYLIPSLSASRCR